MNAHLERAFAPARLGKLDLRNRCAGMIEAPGGVRCPLNDPQPMSA